MRLRVSGTLLDHYGRTWVTQRLQYRQHSYSTVIVSAKSNEVAIPVGSNGAINLTIYNPLRPSPTAPLILYLPRGVFAGEPPFPALPLSSLSRAANATTVIIHYRLSAAQPYPTPIHDVLFGYDWVLKHLVHGSAAHNGFQRSQTSGLAVCGELIGGSLAAMLALTECHTSKIGVRAVALANPITDWTALHTEDVSEKNPSTTTDAKAISTSRQQYPLDPQLLNMDILLKTRKTLFQIPEHYHDPFASPLLFFRTPSSDIIPSDPPSTSHQFAPSPSLETPPLWIKKRRSHRRHPPLGSDLLLPRMRVDVGRENVLKGQGIELAEVRRRSMGMYVRRERGGYGDEDGDGDEKQGGNKELGDQRAEIREKEGLGLWSEEDLMDVGAWIGSVMRRKNEGD